MLDVHPPHAAAHSWKDFLIHIATICVGLLIAVGLEQTVENIHHVHQRHQLEQDLRIEALNNRQVIARDLKMHDLEPWFQQAMEQADASATEHGKARFVLPPAPCIPGSVGTAAVRYFAPSEAVWTTAQESSLTWLLPVEQARTYARLAHNYVLLSIAREDVYRGCAAVSAMQQRFAIRAAGSADLVWTLAPEQAGRLAETASETRTAVQGLCFRLRWSDVYEQGIAEGKSQEDIKMMTVNQELFEDPESREPPSPKQ